MIKGTVGVDSLKVVCFVGAYPHEKIAKQELLVDLKIEADLTKSVKSDSLQDALDYDALATLCASIAEARHYHLIEALAHTILEGIFQKFNVTSVWIRVKKMQGLPSAKFSFVELEKKRS